MDYALYGVNIYFSKSLNIGSNITYAMSMRGMIFAMFGDTNSQG
jgi:hypothetical protein